MKKLIALLLVAAMAISLLCACGEQKAASTTSTLPDATYEEAPTEYRGYEYAVTLTSCVSYVLFLDADGKVVDQRYVEDTTGELAVTEYADPKIDMVGSELSEAAAKFTKALIEQKILENNGYVFVTVTECYNDKVDVFAAATACVDAVYAETKAAGLTVRVEKSVSEEANLNEDVTGIGDATDAVTPEETVADYAGENA